MTEFKSIKELENHTSDGICRELILNQTLAIIKLIEDENPFPTESFKFRILRILKVET